jgi:hypothetical protein
MKNHNLYYDAINLSLEYISCLLAYDENKYCCDSLYLEFIKAEFAIYCRESEYTSWPVAWKSFSKSNKP